MTTVATVLLCIIIFIMGVALGSTSGHTVGYQEGFDDGAKTATEQMNAMLETYYNRDGGETNASEGNRDRQAI